MVVARAQVKRSEAAMFELRCQCAIPANQRRDGVAVAFRLKDLVVLDRADLADHPVDRADEVALGQRAGALA